MTLKAAKTLPLAFAISDARYAKGKKQITPQDNKFGLKGRSARLAEALGGRWTNRGGGYIVSPAAADKFLILYKAGFEADTLVLQGQKASFYHSQRKLENLTLASALKLAKGL